MKLKLHPIFALLLGTVVAAVALAAPPSLDHLEFAVSHLAGTNDSED